MAEYIKRMDTFSDEMCEGIDCGVCPFYNKAGENDCQVVAFLRSIPAADVRPVVLCRDCKYWKQWDSTTHYLCTYVAGAKFIRNADDFCSRGEREES